jgi:pimeloyl-ACP methyl ester carboxylesterase
VTESSATLVLVHGAWSGSWSWWKLTPFLDALAIPHVEVDLPSCSAPDTSVDVHDDAAHVLDVARRIDRPVVLVGNSYGGVVITEGGLDAPNVKHLVYLAAHMPDVGESLISVMSGYAMPDFEGGVEVLPDGRMRLDPDVVVRAAVQQAAVADREVMRTRLSPAMSMGTDFAMAFDRVAWREVPSTYVVCADDRSLDPEAQRAWAKERATEHVEVPFDHCPQVSHPQEIGDLLAEVVRSVR